MTDIVDRLNDSLSAGYSELRKEAAAEIMRIRNDCYAFLQERDALRVKISNLTIGIEYLSNLKKSYEELIGELQDERDTLRAENEALSKNLRGKYATTGATYAHLIAERDALRARIEATEKQKPVAWLDDGTCRAGSKATAHRVVTNETKRDMPASVAASFSVPLCAIPGAQPAPSFADAYQGAMEEAAIAAAPEAKP